MRGRYNATHDLVRPIYLEVIFRYLCLRSKVNVNVKYRLSPAKNKYYAHRII